MSGRPAGVRAVAYVEVVKLAAQRGLLAAVAFCAVGPFLLVVALRLQGTPPTDTLFGRQVHDSGMATSLFLLAFGGQWLLPLLAGLVGGDAAASEDRHGTWKTVATRSVDRRQLFRGKALVAVAWAVLVVALLAVASLVAGLLVVGPTPLTGLSGQPVLSGRAGLLTLAAWASVLPPAVAYACLGVLFSVAGRNLALGVTGPVVVALVMSLLSLLPDTDLLRHLLLPTAFGAWHGLFVQGGSLRPVLTGTLVSAAYATAALLVAERVLLRRDVSGG